MRPGALGVWCWRLPMSVMGGAPPPHTLPACMCIPKEGQDVEMDGDGVGTGVFLRAAAGGRGCVVTGSLSPLPAPTISSKLCPLL